jgi:hypothetical protein
MEEMDETSNNYGTYEKTVSYTKKDGTVISKTYNVRYKKKLKSYSKGTIPRMKKIVNYLMKDMTGFQLEKLIDHIHTMEGLSE